MEHDNETKLLSPEAEQCRFEEVRQRVRKAAKEPLQERQETSGFLANMSHELLSPLNSVIGFSELLLDQIPGPLNSKQQEYLKHIHSSGLHLLSVINDILDLSTGESGPLEMNLSDFSLRETLDDALLMHREKALKKRVTIHLDFPVSTELRLFADQKKLKQILFTLLANAIKFTEAGGKVNVSTIRVNDFIEITVADNGLGIKVDDIPNLFRTPSQPKVTDGDKSEEDWNGLVLIRQLVEMHGGRIWVKSFYGMGSRFCFTLPITQARPINNPAADSNNLRGSCKTILLIEDEQLTLTATEYALHDKGYRIIRTQDGEEGIKLARQTRPDLIVLDLMLPGINGFDVIERLQSEHIAENVPILVLTSMKIVGADRKRLAGMVWRIAEKGSLSTHEFINLVESAVGQNKDITGR